jgi:predicted nucleic acid-binding protein
MTLYLDSMHWIYFFEGNPVFHADTRSLILRAQTTQSTLLTSNLFWPKFS